MAVLRNVGVAPTSGTDLERKQEVDSRLQAGMSRGYVDGRAITLATPKAFKTYVDTQDALYELNAYYIGQDALNVPLDGGAPDHVGGKGQPLGVATLDGSGRIPSAQVPALGAGFLKGPFGVTSLNDGTTGVTPVQIAQWVIGTQPINFRPMVFMSVLCDSSGMARPVVEVRIGDNTQTTYASQTLVAQGYGRAYYNDFNTVTVVPTPNTTGVMQDGVQGYYPASHDTRLTAWLYNSHTSGTVSTLSGYIASASAFLVRVAT